MNKKLFAIPAILLALMLAAFVGSGVVPTAQKAEDSIEYHSQVCVGATTDGEYQELGCQSNVLTDEGKDWLIDEVGDAGIDGGADTNSVDTMQLGHGTAPTSGSAALDTKHAADGLSEYSSLSWSRTSLGNISVSHEWTSTADGQKVNTTGLESSGAGASYDFFAGTSFTDVTLQTDDKINVTWHVWVS